MLVVEENSVYEIDEECVAKRSVPAECGILEKLRKDKNSSSAQKKDSVSF